MNYKLFGNRIVAKVTTETESKSASGIILVNKQESEMFVRAEIVATGRGWTPYNYLFKKLDPTYKVKGDAITPFNLACSQLDVAMARTLRDKGARITAVPFFKLVHQLMFRYEEKNSSFEQFQKQNMPAFQMLDFLLKECTTVGEVRIVLQYLQSENFSKPKQFGFIETIFSQYVKKCTQKLQEELPALFMKANLSKLTVDSLISLEEREELNVDEIIDKDCNWIGNSNKRNFITDVLKKYWDVNEIYPDKEGQTALMIAAKHGRLAMVKQLLADKANVNAQDRYGRSVLMYAIKGKHPKIIEQILATKGIHLELESKYDMNGGSYKQAATAFAVAIEFGDLKTAHLLLNKRVNPFFPKEILANLLELLITNRANPYASYGINNDLQMLHFILGKCIPAEHFSTVHKLFQSVLQQGTSAHSPGKKALFSIEKGITFNPEVVHYIEQLISRYENQHINACLKQYSAILPNMQPKLSNLIKDYLFFPPERGYTTAFKERAQSLTPHTQRTAILGAS